MLDALRHAAKNGAKIISFNDLKLKNEQAVIITSHWLDGRKRSVSNFIVVPFDIPRGNVAAYYPETNPLVPLESYGDDSFTPTSKSIAVTIAPYYDNKVQS